MLIEILASCVDNRYFCGFGFGAFFSALLTASDLRDPSPHMIALAIFCYFLWGAMMRLHLTHELEATMVESLKDAIKLIFYALSDPRYFFGAGFGVIYALLIYYSGVENMVGFMGAGVFFGWVLWIFLFLFQDWTDVAHVGKRGEQGG